jgi:hypothetical protein
MRFGAGDTSRESINITIPIDAVYRQTYYIGVYADYYEHEAEHNESNNASRAIAVTIAELISDSSHTDQEWTSPYVRVGEGFDFYDSQNGYVYKVVAEWNIDANDIDDVEVYVSNSGGLKTSTCDIDVTGDDWILWPIIDDGYDETSMYTYYTWYLRDPDQIEYGGSHYLNQTLVFQCNRH